MNFATLAGVYHHAKNVQRTLQTPNTIDGLRQRLTKLANGPAEPIAELLSELVSLEQHTRAMGADEIVTLVR